MTEHVDGTMFIVWTTYDIDVILLVDDKGLAYVIGHDISQVQLICSIQLYKISCNIEK